MIRAQGFIKKNRLIVLGVADLKSGPIPFSYSTALETALEDGPVDFGSELAPEIETALAKGQDKIRSIIDMERIKVGAEELVIRSRQGDQNAMAILGAIRGRAQAGEERAKRAFQAVHDYIRNHPPTADFAGDSNKNLEKIYAMAKPNQESEILRSIGLQIFTPSLPTDKAIVLVANGPPITQDYVNNILVPYPNPEMLMGIKQSKSKISNRPDFRAGQIIGRAKMLQDVRRPLSSFKPLCPVMAWELGR
jgi:hypothetical protein